MHSPSHHVVRAEGTSASSLESAADSVVIEGHPGSSSSGLSLQLNLGLASEPPTRHGSERSGALSPFTPPLAGCSLPTLYCTGISTIRTRRRT